MTTPAQNARNTLWKRVKLPIMSLLFLIFMCLNGLAQDYDSTFWIKHSFNRPDSILLKDSVLFPPDDPYSKVTYSLSSEKSRWADAGAIMFENQGRLHSAYITLHGDHNFIFWAEYEVGQTFSIGRWWRADDSLICMNWNDTLALHLCMRPKINYIHKKFGPPQISYPFPTRIDHWWFVRRKNQLVPFAGR